MTIFKELDWSAIKFHYEERRKAHQVLTQLHADCQLLKFAELAVGCIDPTGNYSAHQHRLGPRILGLNSKADQRIYELASRFLSINSASEVPALIREAGLKYLGISVGSEISCMMRPSLCWVTNTRTVWAYLLVKCDFNVGKANDALDAYKIGDEESEMAYSLWTAIHGDMEREMREICRLGTIAALASGIQSGEFEFLWADAISNEMYDKYRA